MVYTTGEILGKGGYGSVFSGIRTTDGEKEGVEMKASEIKCYNN